jgi:hypothetical protein
MVTETPDDEAVEPAEIVETKQELNLLSSQKITKVSS